MKYDHNYFRMLDTDGLINEGRDSMDELAIVLADRLGEIQDNHSEMLAALEHVDDYLAPQGDEEDVYNYVRAIIKGAISKAQGA